MRSVHGKEMTMINVLLVVFNAFMVAFFAWAFLEGKGFYYRLFCILCGICSCANMFMTGGRI